MILSDEEETENDAQNNLECITEIKPTISQLINAIRPINDEDDATVQSILQNELDQTISCTICNKNFTNRGSALFHAKKSHSINNITTSIDTLIGLEKTTNKISTKISTTKKSKIHFFCPFEKCQKIKKYFCSSKLLIQHFQKTHYEKNFKCKFCTAKFALERDLRYHNKKVCPKQKLLNNLPINNKKLKIDKNTKDAASQTEKWLVPSKIIVAGKFTKIQPKRTIVTTTEKNIFTQTEILPQQQPNEELNNNNLNYQNNNNLINYQEEELIINQNNNNNICYQQEQQQTVEESTQTFYYGNNNNNNTNNCCCCSSFDFDNFNNIGGESRHNGWTQTPPLYSSFESCTNLMEMQSTSVQTDTILWTL